MSLNIRAFAWAAGFTAAALFLLCAAAVAVAPAPTAAFFGLLFHADLSGIVREVTWGAFIVGLVAWTAGTALTFALGAWLYNQISSSRRAPA